MREVLEEGNRQSQENALIDDPAAITEEKTSAKNPVGTIDDSLIS